MSRQIECVEVGVWRMNFAALLGVVHKTYARNEIYMLGANESPLRMPIEQYSTCASEVNLKQMPIGSIVKVAYKCALGYGVATLRKHNENEWLFWMQDYPHSPGYLISPSQIILGKNLGATQGNENNHVFEVRYGILRNNRIEEYWMMPTFHENQSAILPIKINTIKVW